VVAGLVVLVVVAAVVAAPSNRERIRARPVRSALRWAAVSWPAAASCCTSAVRVAMLVWAPVRLPSATWLRRVISCCWRPPAADALSGPDVDAEPQADSASAPAAAAARGQRAGRGRERGMPPRIAKGFPPARPL
jgi:hypothetical protein